MTIAAIELTEIYLKKSQFCYSPGRLDTAVEIYAVAVSYKLRAISNHT